jgi:hypothetical protein
MSPDGKELFYLAPDDSLMAVPVRTGSQFSAGRPERLFRQAMFPAPETFRTPYVPSADGRRFLIGVPESGAPQSSTFAPRAPEVALGEASTG